MTRDKTNAFFWSATLTLGIAAPWSMIAAQASEG